MRGEVGSNLSHISHIERSCSLRLHAAILVIFMGAGVWLIGAVVRGLMLCTVHHEGAEIE